MQKKYDIFIGYHGTNDSQGTYDIAEEIATWLDSKGYQVFLHGKIYLPEDKDTGWDQTWERVRESKAFLLIFNDSIHVQQSGIIGNGSGEYLSQIRKEIDTFSQVVESGNGISKQRFNCIYTGDKTDMTLDLFVSKLYPPLIHGNNNLLLKIDKEFDWIIDKWLSRVDVQPSHLVPIEGTPVFSQVIPRTKFYVHRINEETRIKDNLSKSKVLFIFGGAGTGKTTIARELLLCEQEKRSYYVSLDTKNITSILQIYEKLFSVIEAFDEVRAQVSLEDMVFLITRYICKTDITLVIDDFDLPITVNILEEFIKSICSIELTAKICLISRINFITLQNSLSKKGFDVYSTMNSVMIGNFKKDEGRRLIEEKLQNRGLAQEIVDEIVNVAIRSNILNPKKLMFFINKIISENEANRIDNLFELSMVFDGNFEIDEAFKDEWQHNYSRNYKYILSICAFSNSGIDVIGILKSRIDIYELKQIVYKQESSCQIFRMRGNIYSVDADIKRMIFQFEQEGDSDIKEARSIWVDQVMKATDLLKDGWNNKDNLYALDKLGGISMIEQLYMWCYENGFYEKALIITNNCSYYFYVRGNGGDKKHSLEWYRYLAAKELDDKQQMLHALLRQLNIAAKRGNVSLCEEIKQLIKGFGIESFTFKNANEEFIYVHAFALEALMQKQYSKAYDMWAAIYQKYDELNDKNKLVLIRWLVESMSKLNKFDCSEMITLLEKAIVIAKQVHAQRDEIVCYLKIIALKVRFGEFNQAQLSELFQLKTELEKLSYKDYLGLLYELVGDIYRRMGRNEDAEKYYQDASQLYAALFDYIAEDNVNQKINKMKEG